MTNDHITKFFSPRSSEGVQYDPFLVSSECIPVASIILVFHKKTCPVFTVFTPLVLMAKVAAVF